MREGKGEQAATRIAGFKKPEMAAEAQVLLDGSGWLPEPLRTSGRTLFAHPSVAGSEPATIGADSAANDGERVVDEGIDHAEDEPVEEQAIAAE